MLPTVFHHSLMEWWCRVPGRSGSTAWEDEKGWGDDNWDEPGAMQASTYGLAFGTAARACPPRRSSGDSRVSYTSSERAEGERGCMASL